MKIKILNFSLCLISLCIGVLIGYLVGKYYKPHIESFTNMEDSDMLNKLNMNEQGNMKNGLGFVPANFLNELKQKNIGKINTNKIGLFSKLTEDDANKFGVSKKTFDSIKDSFKNGPNTPPTEFIETLLNNKDQLENVAKLISAQSKLSTS